MFAGPIWFKVGNVKDVVDLPLSRECESDREWRNDFFELEGDMILVVQLPRRSARLDVAPTKHYQVSYLIH